MLFRSRRRHQAGGGQHHQSLVPVFVVAPEEDAEEEDGEGRDVAEGDGDEVPRVGAILARGGWRTFSSFTACVTQLRLHTGRAEALKGVAFPLSAYYPIGS